MKKDIAENIRGIINGIINYGIDVSTINKISNEIKVYKKNIKFV